MRWHLTLKNNVDMIDEKEEYIKEGYEDESEGESTTGKLTQFIALLFVTIVMAFLFLKIYFF